MTHNDAWERVLAAVAAEAQRAEALLRAPVTDVTAHPVDIADGVPSEWTLPAPHPPLTEMPPVPAELRDRIDSLQARIDDLQAELIAAMAEIRHQQRRPLVVAAPPLEQPHYVDRRV